MNISLYKTKFSLKLNYEYALVFTNCSFFDFNLVRLFLILNNLDNLSVVELIKPKLYNVSLSTKFFKNLSCGGLIVLVKFGEIENLKKFLQLFLEANLKIKSDNFEEIFTPSFDLCTSSLSIDKFAGNLTLLYQNKYFFSFSQFEDFYSENNFMAFFEIFIKTIDNIINFKVFTLCNLFNSNYFLIYD